MAKIDYSNLINFRWGSVAQGWAKRYSLARKWLFIKPDVGNLSAAPQVPFSSFNVIPYYGGYPTGFSLYEYCAWGTPKKIKNRQLMGFTHFSFSGCGDLHHFHNYFLIRPSKESIYVTSERFSLNGLDITTAMYHIKVTINDRCARYRIKSEENVVLIPGFSGLMTKKYPSETKSADISHGKDWINVYCDYSFLKVYWSIKLIKGEIVNVANGEISLSNDVEFIIGFSINKQIEAEHAIDNFNEHQALKRWNNLFDVFDIKDDGDYLRLFYTSLMFALKKPYIFDKEHLYDVATIWDIYKTLLPFIFLFYKKEASIICDNFLKLVQEDGRFYHNILFSTSQSAFLSDQAICLMNVALSTASLYGVKFNQEKAKELQKREIVYYLNHTDDLDRTTYLLDLADAITAYYNAYHVDLGLDKVKELLDKAFEKDYVYLNKKAPYYEGNYANYSFRVSSSTSYRKLNKDQLVPALDKFFGFKGPDTIRIGHPIRNPARIKWYMKHCHRFEGLNNEPDMESMYLYSFFNLSNKQNQVIKDVIANSFSLNDDGVPGNDDNGGLSGWLVFNLLGLFPIVGTDKLKIGLPHFNEVKAGKLIIKKHASDEKAITIDKVLLNNKEVSNNEITALDVSKGGTLDIYLK